MPRELSSSGDEGQLGSEEPDRSSEDEAPPRRRRRISSSSSSGAEAGGEDDARASEVRTNEDAAGGGAEGSDALGFSVPQSSELSLRTVEDRPVTLHINDALLGAYFSKVLAPGQWERRTRKDFSFKYWMSEDQQRRLQVPTLKGTRIFSAVKSVENSGAGKSALEAHEAVRVASKLALRAYEAATALHQKMEGFGPTKIYQENGGVVPELRLLRADSFTMEASRADELARMERAVREDPRWAASLLVRGRWAARENETRHRRLLESLADTEVLVLAAKAYAELGITIAWDVVQASGQVDLAVSAVRRAQVKGLLTDKMKARLRG